MEVTNLYNFLLDREPSDMELRMGGNMYLKNVENEILYSSEMSGKLGDIYNFLYKNLDISYNEILQMVQEHGITVFMGKIFDKIMEIIKYKITKYVPKIHFDQYYQQHQQQSPLHSNDYLVSMFMNNIDLDTELLLNYNVPKKVKIMINLNITDRDICLAMIPDLYQLMNPNIELYWHLTFVNMHKKDILIYNQLKNFRNTSRIWKYQIDKNGVETGSFFMTMLNSMTTNNIVEPDWIFRLNTNSLSYKNYLFPIVKIQSQILYKLLLNQNIIYISSFESLMQPEPCRDSNVKELCTRTNTDYNYNMTTEEIRDQRKNRNRPYNFVYGGVYLIRYSHVMNLLENINLSSALSEMEELQYHGLDAIDISWERLLTCDMSLQDKVRVTINRHYELSTNVAPNKKEYMI
jgi:hypothetical protein